jgi:hypothetical protein
VTMTDEERLHRIAALMLKGARLYWAAVDAGEIPPPPEMDEPSAPVESGVRGDEARILGYIERRGAAAPKDIRLALGLSRATAQRRLSQLVLDGRLVANGKTHSLLYLLNSKPSGRS